MSGVAASPRGRGVFAPGVLALHGFFEPPGVETACRHFGAALAKGNAGARFRVSQCLEKDDAARAAALLREAAELPRRACLEAKPPPGGLRLRAAHRGRGRRHRTSGDKGRPYEFVSVERLLEDFFGEAERVLREQGVAFEIVTEKEG